MTVAPDPTRPDEIADAPAAAPPPAERGWFTLSALNRRRLRNFRANRRAVWSLIIFSVLFFISLFAEFIANDKPLIVQYKGEWYYPVHNVYPETTFGGDFRTEAIYKDVEVECLIASGGLDICFDDPEGILEDAADGVVEGEEIQKGWMLWPPIPFRYDTTNDLRDEEGRPMPAPSAPDGTHLLGTDDSTRDVLARVIYGFRLSVFYALIVTTAASIIGIAAGAVQGFFGGWTD
ncbi:MAG: ABC transporter permease, partial [Pseudomonadota bacterium]